MDGSTPGSVRGCRQGRGGVRNGEILIEVIYGTPNIPPPKVTPSQKIPKKSKTFLTFQTFFHENFGECEP